MHGSENAIHDEDTKVLTLEPGALSGESPPALFVMTPGRYFGKKYLLDQRILYVGRSEMCILRWEDEGLSRCHAIITVEGSGRIRLEDAGSVNGTFVNSRRLGYREDAYLENGDTIRCGGIFLKFVVGSRSESAFLDRLWRKATLDPLTGMFNRRYFMTELEAEIERFQRYRHETSLLLMDIDHFKRVNDHYGHAAGDRVLKATAAAIRDHVRASDVPARLGGEEFAVLLPETDIEAAVCLAERTRGLLQNRKYTLRGHSFRVTISTGAVSFREEMRTAAAFLHACDRQLYRAKRNGRNRTCRVPETSAPPQATSKDVKRALPGGDINLGCEAPGP